MPQSKYWNLAGQAVAIVVSILMAFAIQAWWEETQEDTEARKLLGIFEKELAENVRIVEGEIPFRKAKSTSAQYILELASKESVEMISIPEFDLLINDITWWRDSTFARGALDSIIQGGKLSWIESVELQSRIASWGDELDLFRVMERQDYQQYQTGLLPFLIENTSLSQISNAANSADKGVPGVVEDYESFKLHVRGQRDHRGLLENDTFLSLVTATVWNQEDFPPKFRRFLARAQELQELVQKEKQGLKCWEVVWDLKMSGPGRYLAGKFWIFMSAYSS